MRMKMEDIYTGAILRTGGPCFTCKGKGRPDCTECEGKGYTTAPDSDTYQVRALVIRKTYEYPRLANGLPGMIDKNACTVGYLLHGRMLELWRDALSDRRHPLVVLLTPQSLVPEREGGHPDWVAEALGEWRSHDPSEWNFLGELSINSNVCDREEVVRMARYIALP